MDKGWEQVVYRERNINSFEVYENMLILFVIREM